MSESCQWRWRQWPNKQCPNPRMEGDEKYDFESTLAGDYCREHACEEQRHIQKSREEIGRRKAVSPAQQAHYRKFWAQHRNDNR